MLVALAGYRTLRDPQAVLPWIFGALPAWGPAQFRPWLALFRAIGNVLLVAAVVSVVTPAKLGEWIRRLATAWLLFVSLGLGVLGSVELRFRVDEAPGNTATYRSATHDGGVLQTEMAVRALLAGENPYAIRYDRPPMSRARDSDPAGWRSVGYEENPAFAHLPYPPGVLLVMAPAQLVGEQLFGAFDARFVYLAAAIALAWILGSMVPAGSFRRGVWLATLATPFVADYVIAGRNDVLVLVPLALFGRALLSERTAAAAVWLGVALCMKQFAIFALPFLVLVVPRPARKRLWPVLAIPTAVCLPFFVWGPADFFADLVWFNVSGYPLRWDGFGLSPIAYGLGLVESPAEAAPWGIAGIGAVLVAGGALAVWVRRVPSASRALMASAIWLFVALFLSRFFADNYLCVPALLLAVALMKPPGVHPHPTT